MGLQDDHRSATTIAPDHAAAKDSTAAVDDGQHSIKSAPTRPMAPGASSSGRGPGSLQPGLRVGNYQLVRELGQGGMGAVYLARDVVIDRQVAIKFLLEPNPAFNGRFLTEARATARCRHDHIVVIHDVGELDGRAYMVLEYVEGRSLSQAVQARVSAAGGKPGNHWTPDEVMAVIRPVLLALAHAHSIGIVHRDLKPENIMIAESGSVKVLDFGIARMTASEPNSRAVVDLPGLHAQIDRTKTGAVLGTLRYMSPEQMNGLPADHRSDLWSIGIILFEMLHGSHPLGEAHCPG